MIPTSLPPLYKRTSTGAVEQWRIWVEPTTSFPLEAGTDIPYAIVTEYGQVDGKQIRGEDIVREGKNLGKANATTARQQAEKEAAARWRKKVERNGYVEDIERARAGETDQAGGIAPMLAIPYDPKKLVYPALLQRKYNGVRCIAIYENGTCTLWSRKREQIHCVPHIARAVETLFASSSERHVLDGEIYRHGWSLQKIASFARQKKEPKPGYEELEYHIYDYPSIKGANVLRQGHVECTNFQKPLVSVPGLTVTNEVEAWQQHDAWVQDGYEGAIGRNHDAPYEAGKRSHNLHKFKRFDEREFKIVGHRLGRGKFSNIPVLLCVTDEGKEFECNLPGTLEERAAIDPATLVGKALTVKHFGWSDDKIPVFPVGVAIRDYD